MRITIVQGPFLPVPPICGGAVEKLWYQFGIEFCKLGHSVVHISRSFTGLPSSEIINGVRYLRVPGFTMPSNIFHLNIKDLIFSLRVLQVLPSADLLITNTFWLPILLSLFDHSFGLNVVSIERMPKMQYRFYSRRSLYRCCSSAVRSRLIKQASHLSARSFVVPNSLPFTPLPETLSLPKEKIILYCGRIHPDKGLDLMIKSFLKVFYLGLNDWKLRIIGPHDASSGGAGSSWLNYLKHLAPPSCNSIQWVDPLFDQNLLLREYQKASIFCYPSIDVNGEAMPLAPLEAMAFGAVPVVFSLACYKEYITSYVNGIVVDLPLATSPLALSQAFLTLATSPSLMTSLSNEARRVMYTHHPGVIAQAFIDKVTSSLPQSTI